MGGARGARAPFSVVLRVLSDYARMSPLGYVGTWIKYGRDTPLDKLRAVACPTLVLVGTRDPIIDPLFLDVLLRRLPAARLERVPGGSHALPRAHAELFNAQVIRFCGCIPRRHPWRSTKVFLHVRVPARTAADQRNVLDALVYAILDLRPAGWSDPAWNDVTFAGPRYLPSCNHGGLRESRRIRQEALVSRQQVRRGDAAARAGRPSSRRAHRRAAAPT
jgi:hypothetical protein